MSSTRCESLVVRVIATEYDDQGRPIREQVSQAVKIFRAVVPDVWAEADMVVATLSPSPRRPIDG